MTLSIKCELSCYVKVVITYSFSCDNLWKSIIMALEKPRKLRECFSCYFVATLQAICRVWVYVCLLMYVFEVSFTSESKFNMLTPGVAAVDSCRWKVAAILLGSCWCSWNCRSLLHYLSLQSSFLVPSIQWIGTARYYSLWNREKTQSNKNNDEMYCAV